MKYKEEDIKKLIDQKYLNYESNIIKKKNYIDGNKINRKKYPEFDGKCGTFFHMITKDDNNSVPCKPCYISVPCTKLYTYNPLLVCKPPRKICPYRTEVFDLSDFFNRKLKVWCKTVSTPKGIRNRILCFDDINDYLVVLDEKNGNVKLWTGYPIEDLYRKNTLLSEYNSYINNSKKIHSCMSV